MTDSQAALVLLADGEGVEREAVLQSFYDRWKNDPLVLDKWFSVQAASKREDTAQRVVALAEHPDFSLRNPNRARSLLSVFSAGNQVRFHGADGAGYRFLADMVLALDSNPQLAARMASSFNSWKRFDSTRSSRMQAELERIAGHKPLSDDVFEADRRQVGVLLAHQALDVVGQVLDVTQRRAGVRDRLPQVAQLLADRAPDLSGSDPRANRRPHDRARGCRRSA